MSEFTPFSIEHKELYSRYISQTPSNSSGYSFGNIFMWESYCKRSLAIHSECLCVEYDCRSGIFYSIPGKGGDLAAAVDTLSRCAAEHGVPLMMRGITAADREALESACPGRFTFTPDRDNADYIYSIDSMASLAGKKLHGKRNHCNKFQATYAWEFQPLTQERFDDCMSVHKAWSNAREGGSADENFAIARAFQHWDALGFEGGVLYADGQPVAFTVGEQINEDTVDIHFEKALDTVPGAYPMVAREFARQLNADHPQLRYLNREEDMGIENLRKAKESWYPLYLLEKYVAVENENG